MKTTTIHIEGMSCDGCVKSVERALSRLPGVTGTDVAIGTAQVTFDEQQLQEAQVRAAIEKAGYSVS